MHWLAIAPASFRWAIGGAVVALMIVASVMLTHNVPSKVALAVNAANSQCNEEKLETANKSLVLLHKEEEKARKEAEFRAAEKDQENARLSAALKSQQDDFDAANKPRPDDATPLLDPNDPWLRRKAGAGQSGRPTSPNR